MSSKGLTPDVVTYTALIGGLCTVGRTSAAQELLLEMQANDQIPNIQTYATLLNGLCNYDKWTSWRRLCRRSH
ncbi:Pentatricopeptide repeat [Parasponia andersonii]|uniref:Pentatricopeptide repeat n=1 Tax=Parasponia andersonii TaxID=3476 RepID=A0A2P5DR88_PARAD|nr:Pentatricopeptide repeat [Parasponia andersonii]